MMKAFALTLGLAVIAAFSAGASAQPIALIHARAWTATGPGPIEDATIIVRDGRIVDVQARGAPPAGYHVIDAAGRNVTPGLFSAASQVGLLEVSGAEDTADDSVSAGKLGAAFDVSPTVDPDSLVVHQARSDGVLWTMSSPTGSSSAPFLGQAALLRLDFGDIVDRPRAAMFVRIGGTSASSAGGSRAAQWTLLRQALTEARHLARGKPVAADDRMFSRFDLEALVPVVAGRMPLAVQTHRKSDLRQAIRLASEFQIRVVLVGAAEAWTLATEIAQAGIPVILDPGANLPMTHDEVGARLDNAALLDRAGVVLAIAPSANAIDTNYNVGVASRTAAGLAVANGLSYASAIRALTVGPARIWGAAANTGSIERGKAADLVVWDGDPLEPSSAPAIVIVAGRPVPTLTREQRLSRRYSPASKDDEWPPAYR